jgi:hypothetical protein
MYNGNPPVATGVGMDINTDINMNIPLLILQ